ncbi:MAG: hypothetical protein ACKOU6_15175, partial [Planctomycetota bacterium]
AESSPSVYLSEQSKFEYLDAHCCGNDIGIDQIGGGRGRRAASSMRYARPAFGGGERLGFPAGRLTPCR